MSPLDIRCLLCNGKGCKSCGGVGYHSLTSCPRRMVPTETWEVIGAARDAEMGLLPVAGGTLDQCQSFIDAMRIVRAIDAEQEAELEAKRWRLTLPNK